MPFQKLQATTYPPRLWGLVGYPGSGKSTFATALRAPLLAIDADHRFTEVAALAPEVYALSETPADNANADRIAAILAKQMPGTKIGTIVVDSLTAIITPLVVQALVDKDEGRVKNLAAALRGKALAMRQLQDAVTRWGTDALWIYHLNDARDAQGNELTRATVSATELVRLTRSINMQLEITQADGKRGVKVVWARRGRSGVTLWDETGNWRGMPERIEQAVYDGLSQAEQDKIAHSAPDVFASPELAIAWAVEQGAFDEVAHARNAYEKIKRDGKPNDARAMATLWVADVKRRIAENAETNGDA